MINRLIEPTSGRIFLDGDDVTHADPVELRRRIGYVIQQVGLFPHQTIATNVAHRAAPARLAEGPRSARASTSCSSWSGSTRRLPRPLPRAALRRAAPAGRRRARARRRPAGAPDGRAVRRDRPGDARAPAGRVPPAPAARCGKTIVFVTHDIDEAVKMGDRIAILDVGGVLAQYDTPAEVLGRRRRDGRRLRGRRPRAQAAAGHADRERRASSTRPPSHPTRRSPRPAPRWTTDSMHWVAVVDADGVLHGYVVDDDARGDGAVAERLQRIEAWVPIDGTPPGRARDDAAHRRGLGRRARRRPLRRHPHARGRVPTLRRSLEQPPHDGR